MISRDPVAVHADDGSFPADITKPEAPGRAMENVTLPASPPDLDAGQWFRINVYSTQAAQG